MAPCNSRLKKEGPLDVCIKKLTSITNMLCQQILLLMKFTLEQQSKISKTGVLSVNSCSKIVTTKTILNFLNTFGKSGRSAAL